MRDGPVIVCRGLHKAYGSVHALTDLDATLAPRGLNAVLGPSGRGKSTLLRLLAGLEHADAGSIRVGDVELTALSDAGLRRHRRAVVTYVAQRAAANLVPHLRVRDQLPATPPAGLLDALGLTRRLDARAGELSGGEQARAALASAVARQAPVLLLDEPTAELDRELAARVVDLLLREAARGATVVVATHDADVRAAAATVLDLTTPAPAPLGRLRTAASGGAPVLRVERVSKRYGATHAVEDAALELHRGQTGVVLGRSGSGKSTLLMLLGGWLRPEAGSIDGPGLRWEQSGYVPQRFGLLPELTVAENVRLPGRIAGGDPDPAPILDRLELLPVADRLPEETSVGQQQRAALARALVRRPALLLADEPTSHQDARSAELVWRAIDEACAEGTACLVATHDESAAARADRVWQIADGRLARLSSAVTP